MAELSFDALSSTQAAANAPAGLSGWLARFLLSRVTVGRLTLITQSGQRLTSPGGRAGPEAVLILRRWRALWRTLLRGDVAFGRAYGDGDWDSPDIAALIELAARNMETLDDATGGPLLARMGQRLAHRLNANSRAGSRRNIVRHYDLGNDFYAAWLDPGMSYSAALFGNTDRTLEQAQTAKQDRAIALLRLSGGEHGLEIGCGWGGLADRLLETTDCRVTGVTLSPAQHGYASARLAHFGARADIRLMDYRDISGTYDRIVSIEMIEAVGEAFWPVYFAALRDRLASGGVAVLQAITIAAHRFEMYRRRPDFVQRYIFPGGMLPTEAAIHDHAAHAGMAERVADRFGGDYARTLLEWRARFLAAWPAIAGPGFDTRFRRIWEYYLGYCAGGFQAGVIDVGFHVLTKPEQSGC